MAEGVMLTDAEACALALLHDAPIDQLHRIMREPAVAAVVLRIRHKAIEVQRG